MAALTCPQLLRLRRRAEEDCPNPGVLVQDEEKSDSGPDRNCHCGDAKVYHLRLRTTPTFRSLCPGEGGQVPGRGGHAPPTSRSESLDSGGTALQNGPSGPVMARSGWVTAKAGSCEGDFPSGSSPLSHCKQGLVIQTDGEQALTGLHRCG